VYPGIHHVGRQGVALAFDMSDILLHGFSMWRTARTMVDLEPAPGDKPAGQSNHQTVIRVTVSHCEFGLHGLGWMTAAAGPCEDITIDGNISYDRMPVIARCALPMINRVPTDIGNRHRRWTVRNNYGGLRTRATQGSVCDFVRTEGAMVEGNYHTIGTGVDPVTHSGSTGIIEAQNTWPVSASSIPAQDPPPGPWN
jgi:hypothetical protein